ncbi:hypothetical protein HK099_000376, partial [Clydaea vesicula]
MKINLLIALNLLATIEAFTVPFFRLHKREANPFDLSYWLLQVPSNTFDDWVYPPQLTLPESRTVNSPTYGYNNYLNKGTSVVLSADIRDLVGKAGGAGARTELREYTRSSTPDQALWTLSTGKHIIKGSLSINNVASGCDSSNGGSVTAGQVHGGPGEADLVSLKYYADNGPGGTQGGVTGKTKNGKPYLRGLNFIINRNGKISATSLDANYKLGTKFNFEYKFEDSTLTFTWMNATT